MVDAYRDALGRPTRHSNNGEVITISSGFDGDYYVNSATPLGANEVFVSDVFFTPTRRVIHAVASSDAAGTLFFEYSIDGGNTWFVQSKTQLTLANGCVFIATNTISTLYRMRYINGAVAQTVFCLCTAA